MSVASLVPDVADTPLAGSRASLRRDGSNAVSASAATVASAAARADEESKPFA